MVRKLDKNYYAALQCARDADDTTLKKAYRQAVLRAHPDKGGTDEMFQAVTEAWGILSDPSKRADYDRELKRYNLKDGLGPIPKQTSERESSQRTASYQPTQADRQAQAKAQGPVEIPKDLAGLSVKELKNIMDAIGVSKDDCFEKADLIRRIEEYKEQKKQSKRPQSGVRTGSSGPGARSGYAPSSAGNTSSAFTPSGKDFSCMPEAKAVCFKITSVGNSEVGKSCLIKRYCEGRFVKRYISTIGVDYGVKKLTVKDVDISINFFDLSGNEDYKMIRTEFYEDSNGVMMVYDVDNKDSFASLVHWEEEMKRFGVEMSRIKVVVCGNKCDSPGREVNAKQALEWCKKRGYQHFETSANSSKNVTEAFESLFALCVDQYKDDKKKFGI